MAKKQTSQAKAKESDARTGDEILDSIFDKMAAEHNIPGNEISTILRNTAFKVEASEEPATTSEMKALLSVAEKYNLNPFIREIFAFRNKKGVLVPVVSVDGWIKILNSRDTLDGYKFIYAENMTTIGDSKKCFEWIEIEIYRKDRKFPIVIREYLDECYVARKFTNPWTTHTKRLLRHKTLSQGVRVAFGINDVQDLDEVQRIDDALEAEINREKELEKPETAEDVSPVDEPVPAAPAAEKSEEPPPKVLNQVPKDKQTEPVKEEAAQDPEPITEPEATEEKEDAVQDDLFPKDEAPAEEEKTETEKIPDLF